MQLFASQYQGAAILIWIRDYMLKLTIELKEKEEPAKDFELIITFMGTSLGFGTAKVVAPQLNLPSDSSDLSTEKAYTSTSSPQPLTPFNNFTSSAPSFAPRMFPPLVPAVDYKKRAIIKTTAAILAGLASIPLFFIDPITASLLIVAAVIMAIAAIKDGYQAHKQSSLESASFA